MIERARAGLDVYMLYDEMGSRGLPRQCLEELRAAGVKVRSFRPTQGAGNRFGGVRFRGDGPTSPRPCWPG